MSLKLLLGVFSVAGVCAFVELILWMFSSVTNMLSNKLFVSEPGGKRSS